MSTEATEETPAPGKLKPILLLVVAAVASLALGGALGAFALAPMLGPAAPPAPRAAAVDSTADEADGAGGEAGASAEPSGKGGSGSRTMHTLDNLVLNPAQSNGTRFVMVSLAFELRSAGASETLNQREAELRDVVLRVLGSKTVDDLARLGARDSLKIELRDSVRTLLPRNTLNRVYLTQFVIQ
jgi:flagellar FliL protein